jgi:DNA-binding protein H-NS
MRKELDFKRMSVDEMWQLHEEISRVLSIRLTAEKCELEHRLAQLSGKRDFLSSDLLEERSLTGPRERRRYPRVLPKYRDPDEPSATWSGRGKQPCWLRAALKAGRSIEEFVIGNPLDNQDDRSSTNVARCPALALG